MIAHRLPSPSAPTATAIGIDGRLRLERALDSIRAMPGGRFRPRLVAAVAAALRLDPRAASTLGEAVEAWHEASLVLDDLPCMDDATSRRGMPAIHLVHGESTAILASLARIADGYSLAWSILGSLAPMAREEARHELSRGLGVEGLVGGQAVDLEPAGVRGAGELRWAGRAALGKTVPLLRLALILPALAGGATAEERRGLHRLAVIWGLGYQLLDDADDLAEADGPDLRLGRPNLAHLLGSGLQGRIDRLRRQSSAQIATLRALRPSWAILEPFAAQVLRDSPPTASRITSPCVPSCA